jgi:AP-1-like factor
MLACGNVDNPVPAVMKHCSKNSQTQQYQTVPTQPLSFDWLAQQNGGQFDPVLFGDYREPQDAVLSQDYGTFFNDAFLPHDLGSPFQNLNDPPSSSAPKKDLVSEIDRRLEDDDDGLVVPGEDPSQMMTCTKIWDRLQTMEKFQNGEVDVDNLCSELRTKARCSESGVVINKKDVDAIMGRAVQS